MSFHFYPLTFWSQLSMLVLKQNVTSVCLYDTKCGCLLKSSFYSFVVTSYWLKMDFVRLYRGVYDLFHAFSCFCDISCYKLVTMRIISNHNNDYNNSDNHIEFSFHFVKSEKNVDPRQWLSMRSSIVFFIFIRKKNGRKTLSLLNSKAFRAAARRCILPVHEIPTTRWTIILYNLHSPYSPFHNNGSSLFAERSKDRPIAIESSCKPESIVQRAFTPVIDYRLWQRPCPWRPAE